MRVHAQIFFTYFGEILLRDHANFEMQNMVLEPSIIISDYLNIIINPLTPNDLHRRRAVSPLKIKIPSKNMREKPTNATIIHSVY
jgi:hypothetical protein